MISAIRCLLLISISVLISWHFFISINVPIGTYFRVRFLDNHRLEGIIISINYFYQGLTRQCLVDGIVIYLSVSVVDVSVSMVTARKINKYCLPIQRSHRYYLHIEKYRLET